ncbi:hypothetical protein GUJ93_ZPchr0003g16928 [Zizania palustris]|uniref:DUF4378 domain-containing protein n=1 Tax=Zizania palustris TaxID=103762 RepID=A0A8J5VX57_ZIZPA|nr:hypothetical protein GUJ93_ZPchr0003g16928 [Zizania palustris]
MNRRLLFDCVNEILSVRCVYYFNAGYGSWFLGLAVLQKLTAEEIYAEMTGLKVAEEWMVDELVYKEMSSPLGSWVDFKIESYEAGSDIATDLLSSLLDEMDPFAKLIREEKKEKPSTTQPEIEEEEGEGSSRGERPALLPPPRARARKEIELDHNDTVHDSAIDYYGNCLATASSDTTVKIINIGVASTPSQLLATLSGHYGPVWRVGWAHPKFGSILASCGYDGRVIVWKEGAVGQWSQVHVFDNHKSSVNSIAWAPYELGLCLACGSSDGSISVMTMRPDGEWESATIEQAHPVGVMAVSWAPATALGSMVGSGELVQKLVSGGFDSVVKVWTSVNGSWKLESALFSDMHTDCIRDVSWAPILGLAKSTIASASEDGKVVIWTKGKEGDKWKGNVMHNFEAPAWRVSWSLTGNILSVVAGDGDVTLWKEASDGQWEKVTKVEP